MPRACKEVPGDVNLDEVSGNDRRSQGIEMCQVLVGSARSYKKVSFVRSRIGGECQGWREVPMDGRCQVLGKCAAGWKVLSVVRRCQGLGGWARGIEGGAKRGARGLKKVQEMKRMLRMGEGAGI